MPERLTELTRQRGMRVARMAAKGCLDILETAVGLIQLDFGKREDRPLRRDHD